MSSFKCEICGMTCIDTPKGYITGCSHYPPDIKCNFLTCGWMCGRIFIDIGIEKECDPYNINCCIMKL